MEELSMCVPGEQRGAALIVALIMLVIMTMLGLTTMSTSVTEERMAGNVRSKQLSFDAAEAAVRVAEASIFCEGCEHLTVSPKDGYTVPGLYDPEADADEREHWQKGAWWDPDHANTPDTNWQVVVDPETPGAISQPEYVIEFLGDFARDKPCVAQGMPPGCPRYAYRITARGWGANPNAVTVIQTIFSDID